MVCSTLVISWQLIFSFGGAPVALGVYNGHPPEISGNGAEVLQPLQACSNSSSNDSGSAHSAQSKFVGSSRVAGPTSNGRSRWRRDFVCTAGCSEHEPELERSLAPYAEWGRNTSGLEMLELMMGFCQAHRTCRDPFVMAVVWQGDVHLRACGAKGLKEVSLYLIGPEDLSLVITFLLAVQRIAVLPPIPIVFGLYLSDYTCLVDHHLVGPGVPIFAYLGRDTSWAIPWPSSFTLHSTFQVEQWHNQALQRKPLLRRGNSRQHPWSDRTAKAYWIGTITGPWEFSADTSLMAVPRLKLLQLTKDHPQQLHAEWSGVASYGISWIQDGNRVAGFMSNGSRSIRELTGFAPVAVKTADQWDNFKYYINLDGVVMGGRLNKLLALGGVVLQHKAGYREHIDLLMKPYVHYVPIEYDLSDLEAKVEWLQNNDIEAHRMATAGRSLADQRMRLEDHFCYVWRALEGLGMKTASKDVDASAMQRRLKELSFERITVVDEDMRKTFERFWGAQLERVATGDRKMSKSGIQLLEWTWSRLGDLWKRAHG